MCRKRNKRCRSERWIKRRKKEEEGKKKKKDGKAEERSQMVEFLKLGCCSEE